MYNRLKELRSAKGMNQQSFAKALGIGQSTLAMMEVGKRDITERHIKTIVAVFGVNEVWLRTGAGEMFQQDNKSIIDRMIEEYRLSDREAGIIAAFLELADEDRAAIMRYVDALVEKFSPPVQDQAAEIANLKQRMDALEKEDMDTSQNAG